MARGRSINVKIATDKVIKALEKALVEKKSHKENYKKDKDKYDKARKTWEQGLVGLIKKGDKPVDVDVREPYYNNNKYRITLHYEVGVSDVPECPEAPNSINDWQLKEQIEEIENALRMLKMTEDEVISTSTYNNICQYL